MRELLTIRLPLALSFLITGTANAQTVEEIFAGMAAAENAGLQSIDNYLLKTETMGMNTVEYFEKSSELTLDNGQKVYVMRNVPINEMAERQSPDNAMSNATPGDLRRAADVVEQQGVVMEQEFQKEMAESGVGGIGGGMLGNMLMNPPPDEPWLSANPRDMTSMYATMLRAGARAKEEQAAENPAADMQQRIGQTAELAAQTQIVGRETIDGRDAIGLAAVDLNQRQVSGDQEFTLNKVTMWVDADRFVPLRLKMEGVTQVEGESRPMSIERDDMDYRAVPGCGDMYKPFRSVMRIGGVMTPEQEADMIKARAQMAEFEQQMAQMPQSQRDMIMRQMGPQMEMMKKMVAGGGFEIESKLVTMRCNTGIPDALELAKSTLNF
jgi:hypothetical protein